MGVSGKGSWLPTARPFPGDRPSLTSLLGATTDRGSCFEHRSIRLLRTWDPVIDRPRRRWPTMWYAGIDWVDDHHDAVVIDEQGQRVASCRVAHTPDGLAQLVTFLQGTVAAAPTPQELASLIEL